MVAEEDLASRLGGLSMHQANDNFSQRELISVPPSKGDNVFSQVAPVTPYLYLAAATALSPSRLESLGVTLVINVTKQLPNLPLEGARNLKIAIDDCTRTDLGRHLEGLVRAIAEERDSGGRVLVHCVAGVSRSASVCLAYLVKQYCSLLEAWRHLRTVRPWVRPNYAFMQQLVDWEAKVRPLPSSMRTQLSDLKGCERPPKRKTSCGLSLALLGGDEWSKVTQVL